MLEAMCMQEFDQVYAMMECSFPVNERRTYEGQKRLLEHPGYTIYVLHDMKSGDVKAFLAVWQLEGFAFFEHFAVHPQYRSEGIGSMLLEEAASMFAGRICLEVELPETEPAKRRIAFYERNGFVLNTYPYTQPPICEGREPLPLWIMSTKGGLTAGQFAQVQEQIYCEVYRKEITG